MTLALTLADAARMMREAEARSVVDYDTGCWNWTGPVGSGGYGKWWGTGLGQLAHRVSYQVFVGPIPEGLTLDHLCRNRLCINPNHLEPVTHRENVLRGQSLIARQARQTHCKRGHEFTPDNTYRYANGRRQCKTCRLFLQRRWHAKKKAAA